MGRPINKRYLGPQVAGSYTITGYASFDGGAAEECYIVRQRSVERFEVATDADGGKKMTAMLVEGDSPAEGEFYVAVDDQQGGTKYARKITNRRVYTTDGDSYDLVVGEVASSGADDANVEGLGGMGASSVADAETTTISADPESGVTADGTATSTITVQVKDSNGTNVPTDGHAIVLSTDHGTLATASGTTTNGTYQTTITSGTDGVGTATITGTLDGEAITDTATVEFV